MEKVLKKTISLVALTILPFILKAQANQTKKIDINATKIQTNIFRFTATQAMFPIDETSTIASQYERRLTKATSFLIKAGVGIDTEDPVKTSLHFYSAIESRYYFRLMQRLKKGKTIYNFTSPYISLEQTLYSNSLIVVNQTRSEAFKGSSRTFFNIGTQMQIKKFYIGIFLGAALHTFDFAKPDYGRSFDALHGGLMLGIVPHK